MLLLLSFSWSWLTVWRWSMVEYSDLNPAYSRGWCWLVQCAKYSPRGDFGKYLVDAEKALSYFLSAAAVFFQELKTRPSDRHWLYRFMRVLMMASPLSCRMPPVILSSPGASSLLNILMAAITSNMRCWWKRWCINYRELLVFEVV